MADENLFAFTLVTPERILLTGMAAEVILRTGEGDVTFLDGHAPLVGSVEPGLLRVVRAEGAVDWVAVHGGFVQVEKDAPYDDEGADSPSGTGTRVTLLIGVAELATEIDPDRARGALERAQARLSELAGGRGGSGSGSVEQNEPDADLVDAEAALRRAEVRLETTEATAGAS